MTESVKPERITKPIQLLAAWLAGLLAIDTCFLIAAGRMPVDSWEMRALVVAAIANVPLFLLAVFLLQTKFRPEMQEDSYYSTYLSSKTNERVVLTKDDAQLALVAQRIANIELRLPNPQQADSGLAASPIADLKIGVNKFLEDREKIGAQLAELGVTGYTEFSGIKPPDQRAVAVSQYLSAETRKSVLKIASTLGFKHYTLFDNLAEEADEEVLFGSYGGQLRVIAGRA